MLKIDRTDLQILRILQTEGRISKTDLAERINLSSAACWERLRRLERSGLIRGYRAEIAIEKLAKFATFLVTVCLTNHRQEVFARFEQEIRDIDRVVECYATGGGIDYILKVVARDVEEYQKLIEHLLHANLGIASYYTYIVTRLIKSSVGSPLDAVLDGDTVS